MSNTKLVPVTFLKSSSPYSKGEVAGFPKEKAEKMIENKIAEPYKPGAKTKGAKPSEPSTSGSEATI